MNLFFTEESWEDYLYWQTTDKKILKKINQLISAIKREPFDGIGKPEPLKHHLEGCWSRHINSEHRLVYEVIDEITILLTFVNMLQFM
ncbi:Txe/YoeB family addiction module toxin [Candidatus Parabeggiatoa sp. HSG14]|uniref:Txe/YoeB family addiction module toxin n=1 Tax=Candidatus Parabeggiatoa sp. HSG14 TaxID=3055593 RepID=UPI0025A8B245|nr:Txe/YoeB family addiction module toxin [Thiotrichales bacterium HSG14]